ncbi:UDP-N-acetylenolpyruvoylglucosamine reductase [Methylogaea oryzae]|uniref:UDP-N-acetylenolpyruvoylglucosamine reductase n=2 Tax=Methylogaea oryzae TaxID=1295382 RepID=A0A8D5AKX1_9GAMM|nr:UDP-N-acetylenolpyruvoylglucosamine reductase [Methylogaea oryzae]
MARYATWRAGGQAKQFYSPADREDLVAFLRTLPPQEPLLWLGLGSNLLVRDGGFPGTVIFTRSCLLDLRRMEDGSVLAEAGVACAHVAKFCAEQGLGGAEFLAGIPGTMGGALAMNAGAFGGETWDVVSSVVTVDRLGVERERGAGDFRIGYRQAQGPEGEWFLAAKLRLTAGDTTQSRERIRQLLAQRSATQPTNMPSCGSVFRNPDGDYAARLIENSGLKGRCIGGACVSEKHANFIVNTGAATAADIESLIELVRAEVAARHGVNLSTEVCIVGDKSSVRGEINSG